MGDSFIEITGVMDKALRPDLNFDIVKRELTIGGRPAVLYFVDGFIKDDVFSRILEFFFGITSLQMAAVDSAGQFLKNKIPYVETECVTDTADAITAVLSGPAVLLIEGVSGMVVIDTRAYPTRSVEEPQQDKSLRGARDGFVETAVLNTAMLRRRIRDEGLRMEYVQVGKSTKLDVVISYMEPLADKKVISLLKKRLKNLDINGISMTQQALSEALLNPGYLNPLPNFRFTERPDFASAGILDGKIALIMDNTPAVMLLPVAFADFFKEIDDYYFLPAVSSYTRITRMLINLFSVFCTPCYLLFTLYPQYMPSWLSFMKLTVSGNMPLLAQFLILEFMTDGLRLASLNIPDALASTLGIIGALMLSEFAVNAGWFVTEAVLLMAVVIVAGYTLPSMEMVFAMKFQRMLLLVAVQLFALWGLIGGVILCGILLLTTKTLTGRDYFAPVFPFRPRAFIRLFLRPPVDNEH